MPSFAFLGFKVGMPCSPPTYIGAEWACPYTHSVKHGGFTHSVKHGGKIGLVENKTRSTPWWKIEPVRTGSTPWCKTEFCSRNLRPNQLGSETNQLNPLSVKQNHSAQKITLSVKQK
jgi:hypothetical protein